MNPSDELQNLILRYYESEMSGDASAVVEARFSRQSGVLEIGTQPNEWRVGFDEIARMVEAQLPEMGRARIEAGDLSTFVEGTVGWIADRPKIRLPNGQDLTFRLTAVLHKEDGAWKFVRRHASVGVPNVEVIGKELTTT
jgi:SnoaL-like protein